MHAPHHRRREEQDRRNWRQPGAPWIRTRLRLNRFVLGPGIQYGRCGFLNFLCPSEGVIDKAHSAKYPSSSLLAAPTMRKSILSLC